MWRWLQLLDPERNFHVWVTFVSIYSIFSVASAGGACIELLDQDMGFGNIICLALSIKMSLISQNYVYWDFISKVTW